MSSEDYNEYLAKQQVLYEVEDEQTFKKKWENLDAVYNKLVKDHEQLQMDHNQLKLYHDTKVKELIKDRDVAESQSNEILNYHEEKMKEIKHTIFEIPCKRLYNLAFRWQEPSDSVFLVIDNETREFALRTRDEIEGNIKLDIKGNPVFRHWWNVKC